jgi:hypothetical protein
MLGPKFEPGMFRIWASSLIDKPVGSVELFIIDFDFLRANGEAPIPVWFIYSSFPRQSHFNERWNLQEFKLWRKK